MPEVFNIYTMALNALNNAVISDDPTVIDALQRYIYLLETIAEPTDERCFSKRGFGINSQGQRYVTLKRVKHILSLNIEPLEDYR